jgi:uncharacterized RDD family membrane protein YckC
MTLATPGRRLAGWFLDAVIAGLLYTPFVLAIHPDHASDTIYLPLFLPAMLVLFAYLVAFDGGPKGATPGKRIVGTRVADEEAGGPIGYRRAAIRRLVYVVGALPIYVGWSWLIWDSRHQAWHDKAAHSVVIRTRS